MLGIKGTVCIEKLNVIEAQMLRCVFGVEPKMDLERLWSQYIKGIINLKCYLCMPIAHGGRGTYNPKAHGKKHWNKDMSP